MICVQSVETESDILALLKTGFDLMLVSSFSNCLPSPSDPPNVSLSPPAVTHGAGVIPDILTAAVGGTVMFTTTVTQPEQPFTVVTWSFTDIHGTNINIITSTSVNTTGSAYTGRVTLFRSTGSLELSNLAISDSGEYRVTLIPLGGSQQKGSCKLLLQGTLVHHCFSEDHVEHLLLPSNFVYAEHDV